MLLLPGASVLLAGLENWTRGVNSPLSGVSSSCLLSLTLCGCLSELSPLRRIGSWHGGQRGDAMKVPAGRLQLGWGGAAFPALAHVSHETCRLACWLEPCPQGRCIQLQRVPLLPCSFTTQACPTLPAGAEFQAWGLGGPRWREPAG